MAQDVHLPPTLEAILAEPSASHWLKDALRAAQSRDPVDAARDAELLSLVLAARADAGLSIEAAKFALRPGLGWMLFSRFALRDPSEPHPPDCGLRRADAHCWRRQLGHPRPQNALRVRNAIMRNLESIVFCTLCLLSLNAMAAPIRDADSAINAAKAALQPKYGSTFNEGRSHPYVGKDRRFYATRHGRIWVVEDAPPNRRQWVNPVLRVQIDADNGAIKAIIDTGE